MPKTRTTLTIDEDILRSARSAAANEGIKEGALIERALMEYLGIGVFDRVWARQPDDDEFAAMTDDEIMDLVVAEQHAAREARRRAAQLA
jgi:hypothetical protein